jgi:hypothetical protein
MQLMTSEYFCVDHANISWERVSGEVIAIQLNTGKYYSFSSVAADIWSLADKGVNFQNVLDVLRAFYSSSEIAESEVKEFISKCFIERLLIQCESENQSFDLPNDISRVAWTTPQLNEYSDLQDLILVDPIHDVDDSGWPNLSR